MRNYFFIVLFFLKSYSFGQTSLDFQEVDRYARNAPKNVQSIDELVSYFSSIQVKPIEKARMIYVWLTDNISYDAKAYNLKNIGDNSPSTVFKSKKAVCAGFANLYTELGEKMGLEIETISGVAKGYEFEENVSDDLEESINHAWNAIRIDGEWRVFDATWGEGYGMSNKKGKLESTKKFDEAWFNVNPVNALFTHFPEDMNKQYINNPIRFESFLTLPYLLPSAFNSGWLNPEEILTKQKENKKIDLPEFFSSLNDLKLSAPKDRILKKGKPNEFIIESKEIDKVYVWINEEEFIFFEQKGSKFQYVLNTKNPGEYLIAVTKGEESYPLLQYVIE
ncbi:MAG: transglutaminase domain-containing protein [Crocinitomicaceae bacterium]